MIAETIVLAVGAHSDDDVREMGMTYWLEKAETALVPASG